uniref:GAG-pre-integrase domain-containing protein n=1 Tax=Trichuris muris TaxID=70415 RepID=A0A5S6QHE6_TRIMR
MMAAVEKKSFTLEKQSSFTTREFLPSVHDDDWIVDSGSSSHMSSSKSFFISMRAYKQEVLHAKGAAVHASGIGEGWLHCRLLRGRVQDVLLKNVLYVPEIQENLLSVKRMTEHGFQVTFRDIKCKVVQGTRAIALATQNGNIYKLNRVKESARMVTDAISMHRWHRRLGHRDPAAIAERERKVGNDESSVPEKGTVRELQKITDHQSPKLVPRKASAIEEKQNSSEDEKTAT